MIYFTKNNTAIQYKFDTEVIMMKSRVYVLAATMICACMFMSGCAGTGTQSNLGRALNDDYSSWDGGYGTYYNDTWDGTYGNGNNNNNGTIPNTNNLNNVNGDGTSSNATNMYGTTNYGAGFGTTTRSRYYTNSKDTNSYLKNGFNDGITGTRYGDDSGFQGYYDK
jgi:hypothetical protein